MTLSTLIKKSLREGKYLHPCLVDFRKAYDSICRQGLIYKLKEFGLTGDILEIITTLYEGKFSQSFSTKMGLKQGDVLCNLLLSLYINHLPDFLNIESNREEGQLHTPKLVC